VTVVPVTRSYSVKCLTRLVTVAPVTRSYSVITL
jgi:hypothetical protein